MFDSYYKRTHLTPCCQSHSSAAVIHVLPFLLLVCPPPVSHEPHLCLAHFSVWLIPFITLSVHMFLSTISVCRSVLDQLFSISQNIFIYISSNEYFISRLQLFNHVAKPTPGLHSPAISRKERKSPHQAAHTPRFSHLQRLPQSATPL